MNSTENNTSLTFTAFEQIVDFVRELYGQPESFIPLHVARFRGKEKEYVMDCLESTCVSSVGSYVDRFEEMMRLVTGAKYAIATVNGTSALHTCLMLAEVKHNDLVITQPLSFIATCNAISYLNASPLFVDVSPKTLGMCPDALQNYLEAYGVQGTDGFTYHKITRQRIKACVPMHTFGHPCEIDRIASICEKYTISLVEDAAQSIGSKYKGQHTGTFGLSGAFSFNGNKTITAGGGGAIVTNSEALAKRAKHITTQAKKTHPWAYSHDEIGYNYRMPNLNAALICAQLEQLDEIIESKRKVAGAYAGFFEKMDLVKFVKEPIKGYSNYWLNAILFPDASIRDEFLDFSNKEGVMTRPVWGLLSKQQMFLNCLKADLSVAEDFESRLVNLPSSAL